MAFMSDSYMRKCAPVYPLSYAGGILARIQCAQCGGHDEWRINGALPPAEILPRHFAKQNWRVGRKPICPACQQSKPKEKPMPEAVQNVTPIKPETSEAAKKVKRMIYLALEDYYDDNAKAYRPGHTDESVAKEVGASPSFVATIREADFGPLSPPSEFDEIRKEASALASEIGKLQAKLEAMSKRNGWKA